MNTAISNGRSDVSHARSPDVCQGLGCDEAGAVIVKIRRASNYSVVTPCLNLFISLPLVETHTPHRVGAGGQCQRVAEAATDVLK